MYIRRTKRKTFFVKPYYGLRKDRAGISKSGTQGEIFVTAPTLSSFPSSS